MPWRVCVSIGIASLLTACICLVSSYTSYKAYLQAQSSMICGFINELEKDSAFNGDEEIIGSKYNIYRVLLILVFLFPALLAYIHLSELLTLDTGVIAFIVIAAFVIDKYYIGENIFEKSCENPEEENKPFKKAEEIRTFLKSISLGPLTSKANGQIQNVDEIMSKLNDCRKKIG